MNLSLALLLCGAIAAETSTPPPAPSIAAAAVTPRPASSPTGNLNFGTGSLDNWEGGGFKPTTGRGNGPSLTWAVTSADGDTAGRTAMLHRAFQVPVHGGVLRCRAHAVRAKDCPATSDLDVVVLGDKRRKVAKQVRTGSGWQPAKALLPSIQGKPQEYMWDLTEVAGQAVRIAVVDEDKRPGCHVYCGGFRYQAGDEYERRDFHAFMTRLTTEHKLMPAVQVESEHFLIESNAEETFTHRRANNCELMYDLFYDHFRRKGFQLYEPKTKLMVAVFDSHAGFEAYVGQGLPSGVTGLYHPKTNRLLVYDYGTNRDFVEQKNAAESAGRKITSEMDRRRRIDTISREAQEFRSGANIGTVMHEVAHQISFNSGLLSRNGDIPVWLAEGLACYCEPTQYGVWTGIGEPNPERIKVLAALLGTGTAAKTGSAGGGKGAQATHVPLRELITTDAVLRDKRALIGYAQSWALFRMLMEERPAQLRSYLADIYGRKTADRRLDDFTRHFGSDLARLELRYGEYMRQLVAQNYREPPKPATGRPGSRTLR